MTSEHDRTYAQALAALGERAGLAGTIAGDAHPDDKCAWDARLFAQYTAGTLPETTYISLLRHALWTAWGDALIWERLADAAYALLEDAQPDT